MATTADKIALPLSAEASSPLLPVKSSDALTSLHIHPSATSDESLKRNGEKYREPIEALLYQAALKGDWKAAKTLVNDKGGSISVPVTPKGDTILHIAAGAKRTEFVREVVKRMSEDELALPNKSGYTAFCYAAVSGVVEIAEAMYQKNKNLPTIRHGEGGQIALCLAAALGKRKMISYLYHLVPPHGGLVGKDLIELLEETTQHDMFDLALKRLDGAVAGVAQEPPNALDDSWMEAKKDALGTLASKPSAMVSHNQERMWKRFASITDSLRCIPCMEKIHDFCRKQYGANELVRRLLRDIVESGDQEIDRHLKTIILRDAVKEGNVEFLAIIFRLYPELITLSKVKKGHTIFHVAVQHRQENVFKLIYEIGAYRDLIALDLDDDDNNILHLAGKKPTQDRLEAVSGAAFQMQRELSWFKEVEKMVPPSFRKRRFEGDKTPREVFSEDHESLLDEAKKWMTQTASSCTIVATLTAGTVFAAAFAVPGGSNPDTGVPKLVNSTLFDVFVISDIFGMFTSATSIILFSSILTSSNAEDNFLASLPTKLMFGLTALFFSVICMVVAFTSSCFLIYKDARVWTPGLIVALASMPVIVFLWLQSKLWIGTIRSIFWSKFQFRPSKIKLY